jgi:hypothetical protein
VWIARGITCNDAVRCVLVTPDYAGGDCARTGSGTFIDPTTGEYLNQSIIQLRTDWNNPQGHTTQSRLQEIIAHELAHNVGLNESGDAGCNTSNTIMHSLPSCYADPPPTELMSLSSADAAASNDVYRNWARKVCGW